MKISVITLHHVTNFGSMLQTYAMQTHLKSMGYEVEFVDFVPKGLTFHRAIFPANNYSSFMKKTVRFIPAIVCNAIQFAIVNSFIKTYIHVTPKRYSCYADIVHDVPVADIYLSGSDQVWNTQNSNPKDDLQAYYLNFAPEGCKRVAYAGSFGKTNFSSQEACEIAEYLKKYTAISVREDSGLATLRELDVPNGVHVLDPTFLLEPQDWLELIKHKKVPKLGYVFVYNLNRNKTINRYAQIIAKEKKLRIINFADTFEFIPNAQNRLINTALDFVNHIANADYVITDSFHGTSFSLIFSRQFVCVSPPKYSTRLGSILNKVGLENRMFFGDTIDMSIALTSVNYDWVSSVLKKEKEKSKSFLQSALMER
jgi:polysaccharide pyruvyl transferase WcaK-like protein